MSYVKTEPRLCSFRKVEISIPSKKLIKIYFKKNFLDAEETIFLKALEWKVEAAENRLAHVKSIIVKALLKKSG